MTNLNIGYLQLTRQFPIENGVFNPSEVSKSFFNGLPVDMKVIFIHCKVNLITEFNDTKDSLTFGFKTQYPVSILKTPENKIFQIYELSQDHPNFKDIK